MPSPATWIYPSGKRLAFSVIGTVIRLKATEGAETLYRLVLTIYEWYAGRSRSGRRGRAARPPVGAKRSPTKTRPASPLAEQSPLLFPQVWNP